MDIDGQLFRQIVSLLLASAEQIALQKAVFLGVLQKAEGFEIAMLDEVLRDPKVHSAVHADFEPLWQALDHSPIEFYNALLKFEKLNPHTKAN